MKDILISENISLKDAYKKLDQTAEKVLLVVNEKKQLLGTLTDGDVRRALLRGKTLEANVKEHYNCNPIKIFDNEAKKIELSELFREKKVELIPVVDENNIVIDYITWQSCFGIEEKSSKHSNLQKIPVVIMAGGKGSRLAPFTTVLPKPLIPIGDETILEKIIREFKHYRMKDFYFTLNFKGEMIKAYFDGIEKDYSVNYLWEKGFNGTAGSLKMIEHTITGDFIVSNCDIIVKAKYDEVLDFHRKSEALITVLSSIQHHQFPYGVVEFEDGGTVTAIREKPEFSFPINTGVYILNSECLKYIPENELFHMTHLIEKLIREGEKVITYPVNEKNFIDIGQWSEYRDAIRKMVP
jgi:dTDP-glucose pyrophosphorylase/CBS domain-containing protein